MKNQSGLEGTGASFFAGLTLRHPGLVLLVFLSLAGLAVHYLQNMPFRTSYLDLLPAHDPLVAKYEEVQAELSNTDVAAVLLTLVDPPVDHQERTRLLAAGAERVMAHLDPRLFLSASYRVRTEFYVPPELLVFRSMYPEEREALAELAHRLLGFVPVLATVPPLSVPAALPDSPTELDQALTETEGNLWAVLNVLQGLPEGQEMLSRAVAILRAAGNRTPPGDEGHPLLSLDRARLVLQVWPVQPAYASMAFNRQVRDALLGAVEAARLEELGIRAGITGLYVTLVEVEDTIRQDMLLVTIISGIVILLLTLLSTGSPVLAPVALAPVALSAGLTVAWAKFAVNGFNLLTTFLPALILGLGADFSLHLISRFSEARADGLPLEAAVSLAVRSKGISSLVAALTTAAVFACLLFSRSRALWELGVIMALGIVVAYFTVFLMVPALLVLVGKLLPRLHGRPLLHRDRLFPLYRNFLRLKKGLLLISLLLTAIALGRAVFIQFKFASADLVPPTPSQQVARELVANFSGTVWLGDTFRVFVPQARDILAASDKLKTHPLVQNVFSAWDLLPTTLLGEAARFRDLPLVTIRSGVARLSETMPRWPEIIAKLEDTGAFFSLAELQALLLGEVRKAAVFAKHAENLFQLADEFSRVDAAQLISDLEGISSDLREIEAFAQKLKALPAEDVLIDQIIAFLPEEIRMRSKISRGYVVEVQVSPAIHEGHNLAEFVNWLRVQGFDYVGAAEIQAALEKHMRWDFFFTSGLALVFILVIMFLDLRRVGETLLCLGPVAMGYGWMLGGMALLGVRFNFTNIVISPLLIGLGVDGAVHLLHRAREEASRDGVARAAAATAGAILGSYFTTMSSFGALLSAQTPGLRFLGISALLGLGFTAFWTALFLPAVLGQLRERAGRNKVPR